MHVDARQMPNHSVIEGDICIIGAGASGISMALDFLKTPYNVILLEGGGFQLENAVQELYSGKTTGQRYYPLRSSRLHFFGGTTGHWAGYCSTFDPIDFKKRNWVPDSGWPIKLQDLIPHYQKAQELLELGPFHYSVEYWKSKDPSLISLPFDKQVIWDKIWQFSPPTRFGQKYKDAILKASNIHLYTYANAVDIVANDQVSHIRQVTVKNLEGKQHTVKAKKFVLACCSIQNARLLLASNQQAPKGLGNDHDLVGRYFMDHLEVKSADLLLPAPAPLKLYKLDFFITKARAELALTEKTQKTFQILNGTSSLSPKEVVKNEKAWIDKFPDSAYKTLKFWEDLDRFNKSGLIPKMATLPFKEYEMFTRMEQAPNPSSRISLDLEKDALGVPRAKLNWQFTSLEKKSIRKLYEVIGQQVGLSGLGTVRLMEWLRDEKDESWPTFLGGGWHHTGTTRMSGEKSKGVVNKDCRVFGIDNLYVAGSSCFPTSGAANPTLTIVAMSLRLANHLKTKSI